jgi:hypothetical protein
MYFFATLTNGNIISGNVVAEGEGWLHHISTLSNLETAGPIGSEV